MAKINDDFVGVFRQQLKGVTRQLSRIRKEVKTHGLEIKVGNIGHQLPGPIPNQSRVCFASMGIVLRTEDFIVALNESLKWLKAMVNVSDMKSKR